MSVDVRDTLPPANHTVHKAEVEGPYVHGDQFVVRFKMDVTPKGGKRMSLDEVGLYTVKNGKIVEERFSWAANDPLIRPERSRRRPTRRPAQPGYGRRAWRDRAPGRRA